MRILFIWTILTFVFFESYGQLGNVDSMKKQLSLAQTDTAKLNTLVRLAYYYQDSKPDSLSYYAKQLLKLAQSLNNARMVSIAFSSFGQYEYILGNYSPALQWMYKSLELAENIKDTNRMANANNLIGNTYKEYGDFDKAIAHYLICNKIATQLKDPKQNDLFGCLNLGEVYALENKPDSALPYAQQAYAIAIRSHSRWIGGALTDLGYAQMLLNDEALSAEYFREGIRLFKENFGNSRSLSKANLAFASLFLRYHQRDSAIYFGRAALEVASAVPYLKGVSIAAHFLFTVYDSVHRPDSALFYLKLFAATNDSLNNRAKIANVENEIFTEQVRQREKEEALQKATRDRQQNIQYALIALGLVVFIIFFLLLSRSIIVNEKWIEFLGLLGLIIVFEFINLLVHPYLATATDDTPVLMLVSLVGVAALLIPVHHRLERWVTEKMVEKNKWIRLNAAKKTIERLDKK